ncbi:protein of unknown function DUF72 [Emticicia oligotrophica DSM 17448]|uniref:DUF72 domain-containing protein n=1 Tax=Emticicia oligotrophica (strain DSM 17448 / CIP 109782 / MTCC 6937 / GPTSA100-15) TaxID=929562 RepID=A0ABM5N1H2_EMTOG|nr:MULTISPECIES: DUF72 domain-containing protein [Emticicia]AFK03235.1 protein of unknown function DUF72 [Emticicia oligotrophica DSM 17448]
MDFGKLQDISKVDFTLPADNPFTAQTLAVAPKVSKPELYFGPPIWANKDWIGKIYPSNAKDKDFLYYYTRQFNTIELNVTHYQIPTSKTVERWKESAADGFKFCPKFPQAISHDRQLIGCEFLTEQFCEAILGLGDHLGMTFLQLAPTFDPRRLKSLEAFLKQLPKGFPVSVEFRHQDWFSDKNIWAKTCEMLAELNVGTVISDVSGRRDVLHTTLTIPKLTLRFVGNELHPTDYTRVDDWCERLKKWLDAGLNSAFIFVHCGENEFAPELTKYWINTINAKYRLAIKEPKIMPQAVQGSLF